MSENVIPNRVSWVAEGRRAHGYLVVADDALHLICLKDESETAGAVGTATARQFGLVGALVGAGVSAAREASRKKELQELYQAQQQTPLPQRLALHKLSRTLRKADVTAMKTGAHLQPTLQLVSGTLAIQAEGSTAGAAVAQWAGAQQVKVEVVEPPKFPWKVVGVVLLIPVALVVLHLLISVPYALRHNANQHRAVDVREAFVSQAEKAHAALEGPSGAPFLAQCQSALAGVTPDAVMTYVGPLPANAQKLAKADYERFPQLAYVEPPMGSWDDGRLDSSAVKGRWTNRVSFFDSYRRVVESPLEWSRVANHLYGLPVKAPTRSVVAKVTRVDLPSRGSSTVSMTAAVLDAQGAALCAGDLTFVVPPEGKSSSVGLGFELAEGLPQGLFQTVCGGASKKGACRDAGRYAALKP